MWKVGIEQPEMIQSHGLGCGEVASGAPWCLNNISGAEYSICSLDFLVMLLQRFARLTVPVPVCIPQGATVPPY